MEIATSRALDLGSAFGDLPPGDLEAALRESPIEGFPEIRRRWRERQRHGVAGEIPSSLPLVTAGLSHGISLVADLFGGEGKAVAVPTPFWGNYRQAFAVRTGAKVLTAPAYVDGRYNPRAIADALAGLPEGEPAIGMLNIPSNPGSYTPDREERRATVASLLAEADRRPLVIVCDDAYAGLVFEPEIPRESLFWDLAGAHPALLAVKIDGATKELSFFGGRLGFLTFGVEPESDVVRQLEARIRMLVRTEIGSPPAVSQVVALQALRSPTIEREVEAVRLLLEGRYRVLKRALAGADPDLLTVLPFNSGCFALVEIPARLGGELRDRPPPPAGPPRHRPGLHRAALPADRPLLGGRGGDPGAGATVGDGAPGAGPRRLGRYVQVSGFAEQTQLVQELTSVGPHCMGQLFEPQTKVAPPATCAVSRGSRLRRVSRLRVSLRFMVFIVSSSFLVRVHPTAFATRA